MGQTATSTREWAGSLGISVVDIPPAVEGYSQPCPTSAEEIARRTLVLHGVVAVAYRVEAGPVMDWFRETGLWDHVSPQEREFLQDPSPTDDQRNRLCWHQEAEWTLLWAVGKVASLGLPTRGCDTRLLVDEIIPELGSDIAGFIASSEVRSPGVLLAEDDRTYSLWCEAHAARRRGEPLPADLSWPVLYERRYAFEWLDGTQEWDSVRCDA